jgi:hypothetical protein
MMMATMRIMKGSKSTAKRWRICMHSPDHLRCPTKESTLVHRLLTPGNPRPWFLSSFVQLYSHCPGVFPSRRTAWCMRFLSSPIQVLYSTVQYLASARSAVRPFRSQPDRISGRRESPRRPHIGPVANIAQVRNYVLEPLTGCESF